MKTTALFYFLGFSVLNLIMDIVNNRFSQFDLILVFIFVSAFFIKKKWFSKVIGSVFAIVSLIVLFAIFISQMNDLQTNQLNETWTYLMGYSLSLVTLFFSLILNGFLNINSIFVERKM